MRAGLLIQKESGTCQSFPPRADESARSLPRLAGRGPCRQHSSTRYSPNPLAGASGDRINTDGFVDEIAPAPYFPAPGSKVAGFVHNHPDAAMQSDFSKREN